VNTTIVIAAISRFLSNTKREKDSVPEELLAAILLGRQMEWRTPTPTPLRLFGLFLSVAASTTQEEEGIIISSSYI